MACLLIGSILNFEALLGAPLIKTSKTMVLQRPPAGLAAVKKIQNDTILEKIEKKILLNKIKTPVKILKIA